MQFQHALARHQGEHLTFNSLLLLTKIAVAIALDSNGRIFDAATLFLLYLPYSRTMESEADHIGLFLMAKACFNPEEAIGLYRNLDKHSHGSPPQWLSTHPTHANRIEDIKKILPKAKQELMANCITSNTGNPRGGNEK